MFKFLGGKNTILRFCRENMIFGFGKKTRFDSFGGNAILRFWWKI